MLPVTPSGGGEHPEDDELERLRELSGGQPAPAPGEGGQGQQRVEQQGQGGLGWHRAVIITARPHAPSHPALAPGDEEAEDDESCGGENHTDLGG